MKSKKIYICRLCDTEFTEAEYNNLEDLIAHLFSNHFELISSLANGLIRVYEEKEGENE